jgi:hypothetical protein
VSRQVAGLLAPLALHFNPDLALRDPAETVGAGGEAGGDGDGGFTRAEDDLLLTGLRRHATPS